MTSKSRKSVKTIVATLIVATLASTSFVAPAIAGGSFSLSIAAANNSEEAEALRAGMALYSIFNAVQGGAIVSQNGFNNMAGIGQNGWGNQGIVHQEGNGHVGTIQRNGNNNAYGLFQFGEDTNVQANQFGNGNTGATFVFGW